jgi:hypothetical protein
MITTFCARSSCLNYDLEGRMLFAELEKAACSKAMQDHGRDKKRL